MLERFKGKDKKIIAAVNLPVNEDTVKSAIGIAKKTQMSLRFVHVLEPMNISSPIYLGEHLLLIAERTEKIRVEEARNLLESSTKPFQDEYPFETDILFGSVANEVKKAAVESKVDLIVAGVKTSSHRFVPSGFSTAIGLMSDSPIPVLALPEGKYFNFDQDVFTTIVADDLSSTSNSILSTIAEFELSYEQPRLIHFHAHPESKEYLSQWADEAYASMLSYDPENKNNINRETMISDIERNIREKLTKRIPHEYLENQNFEYLQIVRFGNVVRELTSVVEEFKPNLIGFGRHHFIHRHPFSIGKVPFNIMLKQKIPILVASGDPS